MRVRADDKIPYADKVRLNAFIRYGFTIVLLQFPDELIAERIIAVEGISPHCFLDFDERGRWIGIIYYKMIAKKGYQYDRGYTDCYDCLFCFAFHVLFILRNGYKKPVILCILYTCR